MTDFFQRIGDLFQQIDDSLTFKSFFFVQKCNHFENVVNSQKKDDLTESRSKMLSSKKSYF